MPTRKSKITVLAGAITALAFLTPPVFAQPPKVTVPFPAEHTALIWWAARTLDRHPLRPIAGPAGASRATRQIVKPGSPRDVLVGFYETTAGRAPRLVALEWGRDVQRPGSCQNRGTTIEVATFLLIWPPDRGPWASLRYTGCLGPNGRLTGPPTQQPLPLDDPATRALSRAILTRLTPKL